MGKNLDAELAEAAGLDEDPAAEPSTAVAASAPGVPEPRRPLRGNNIGLLAVLLVMVGGLVCLFMFGFQDAAIYSLTVEKLRAKGEDVVGRRVRIDGELVPGTLTKRDRPCEYRFTLREPNRPGVEPVEIRYPQCVVPDTFRDMPQGGVMVTAEGALHEEVHFEANLIMAKCSSKYNADTHEMKSE